MKKLFKQLLSLAACVGITFLNQNCGGETAFEYNELASTHSPSILDIDRPSSKARVGDRVFMASVFADVFLPQDKKPLPKGDAVGLAGKDISLISGFISESYSKKLDIKISDTIVNEILKNVNEFHGGCSTVDRDSTCAAASDSVNAAKQAETSTVAPGTVTREGYRLSACKLIVDEDRAISNVILNTTGSRKTEFKEDLIMDVYDLFYPGQQIGKGAYSSLVDSFRVVKGSGENNLNVWRSVIIPICYSSGWQIP